MLAARNCPLTANAISNLRNQNVLRAHFITAAACDDLAALYRAKQSLDGD